VAGGIQYRMLWAWRMGRLWL